MNLRATLFIGVCSLCFATPSFAWNGGGGGGVRWSEGQGEVESREASLTVNAVTRAEPYGAAHTVVSFDVPGVRGDGVITVYHRADVRAAGIVTLPDPRIELTYTEYGPDGALVFQAAGPRSGRLRAFTGSRLLDLEIVAEWVDEDDAEAWRRVDVLQVVVRGEGYDDPQALGGGADEVVVTPAGGCDGSAWETDSYEPESERYGETGGGCDGDDMGGETSYDSGGCDGCEGDAMAGCQRTPRSALILRAINWTPWLLVFLAIRLLRRRRTSATTY